MGRLQMRLRRLFGSEPDQANAGDAQVIQALRAAGADLGQPREVVNFLYFPTEASVRAAIARVDRDDRRVHVIIDPKTGKSSMKVTLTMQVSQSSIADLRRELEAAARAGRGEYDGWEAAATP